MRGLDMSTTVTKIPKPTDACDEILAAVLTDIKLRNAHDDKLIRFTIESDVVVLTYEG